MSRNPYKRRDSNERQIVDALEQVGCRVWQLSGEEVPDLLVWRAGRPWVMEVKTKTGTKTEAQRDIPWPIVRTVDEALRVVGEPRTMLKAELVVETSIEKALAGYSFTLPLCTTSAQCRVLYEELLRGLGPYDALLEAVAQWEQALIAAEAQR